MTKSKGTVLCNLFFNSKFCCWGMLRFGMASEIHFALERASTILTAERLMASMLPKVRNQIWWLTEGFTTHCAFMRLFSCKDKSQMYLYQNCLTRTILIHFSYTVYNRTFSGFNLPVWIYVCFFISDFWWKLFPQLGQGQVYGLVFEWMSRWVDNVDDLLKDLPHWWHWNCRSWQCTALLCCVRETAWPKVLLQAWQAYGRRLPVWARLTCTSRPWTVLKSFVHFWHE